MRIRMVLCRIAERDPHPSRCNRITGSNAAAADVKIIHPWGAPGFAVLCIIRIILYYVLIRFVLFAGIIRRLYVEYRYIVCMYKVYL